MRVFLSHAYTGEDHVSVRARMKRIVQIFEEQGVEAYCDLFDSRCNTMTQPKQFIEHDLKELRRCDKIFVIMTSARRSEGMLIEVGAALAFQKPIVLMQCVASVGSTYLDTIAQYTVLWQNDAELFEKIKNTILLPDEVLE